MNDKKLCRSSSDKIFAGVCGGLADYFAIDAAIIRLLFILVVALGGSGFIIYILLWLIMPKDSGESAIVDGKKVEEIAGALKEKAAELKNKIKDGQTRNERRGSNFWGWLMVISGAIFLFNGLAPFWLKTHFFRYWPLLFIVVGLTLIAKNK